MTLETLANRPRAEVEEVLADLALTLAPNPGVGRWARGVRTPPEVLDAVLRELAARVGVPFPVNNAAGAGNPPARLLAAVGSELARAAIGGKEPEIRRRLGDRGDLPPSQYQLAFQQLFVAELAAYGAKLPDVERAVRHPDGVSHLDRVMPPLDPPEAVSLFSHVVRAKKRPRDAFTLIVVALREQDKLTVTAAWRAYHAELPEVVGAPPLAAFRAFCERYGIAFTFGDVGPEEHLVVNRRVSVPGPGGFTIQEHNRTGFVGAAPRRMFLSFPPGAVFPDGRPGTLPYPYDVEVTFAYAVVLEAYARDVRRHGGSADPSAVRPRGGSRPGATG